MRNPSNASQSQTTGQWKEAAWSEEACLSSRGLDGRTRARRLPGGDVAPGCTMGRLRAGEKGRVMVVAILRRETSGPAIHVDVTLARTTSLHTVADQVPPLYGDISPEWKWSLSSG